VVLELWGTSEAFDVNFASKCLLLLFDLVAVLGVAGQEIGLSAAMLSYYDESIL